tara:strand:+ start:4149 stop:5072 length:924 start_codon:yes stop_codon:yes gene_type:complete
MKLYRYPQASPHNIDDGPYRNCIPLGIDGLAQHCTIVNDPNEADYFHIGQIREDSNIKLYESDGSEFEFFKGNEHKHIVDMEGEGGWEIPEWLRKCILTTMGPLKRFDYYKLFTRPCFSSLMMDCLKDERVFDFPKKSGFGFRGCINHPTRQVLFEALKEPTLDDNRVRREAYMTAGWFGPAPSRSEPHLIFEELMLKHPLSLCPRGAGIASTRVWETCAYGRVPVIVSNEDFYQVSEDEYDTSFMFKIIGDLSPNDMANELLKVYNYPIEELKERGIEAKKYFDNIIKVYFNDPTLFFLNWLQKNV